MISGPVLYYQIFFFMICEFIAIKMKKYRHGPNVAFSNIFSILTKKVTKIFQLLDYYHNIILLWMITNQVAITVITIAPAMFSFKDGVWLPLYLMNTIVLSHRFLTWLLTWYMLLSLHHVIQNYITMKELTRRANQRTNPPTAPAQQDIDG
ncbi:uncharacterized protein LOC132259475 [Phlebotomus argentipes]|uniref:uncharacterized protein LOC132259475 n=1 Tax=Phlebotomus argentipes TaxID=94469 RepID=UPI00289335B2|nr:uncharacterized protein LOC132259475 [Phlebotomus argentipes]